MTSLAPAAQRHGRQHGAEQATGEGACDTAGPARRRLPATPRQFTWLTALAIAHTSSAGRRVGVLHIDMRVAAPRLPDACDDDAADEAEHMLALLRPGEVLCRLRRGEYALLCTGSPLAIIARLDTVHDRVPYRTDVRGNARPVIDCAITSNAQESAEELIRRAQIITTCTPL